MPELPEVETIVRQLHPVVVGRAIRRSRLVHEDVLQGVTRRQLLRGLTGARIVSVDRRAKHAVILLDRGTRLVIQPGMTGSLLACKGSPDPEWKRYAVLQLNLDRNHTLIFKDVRRFGAVLLLDADAWERYDGRLGPEPLGSGFTARQLAERVGASAQAIKKALMDQQRLAGVGNIYANEALHAARLDPSKPANRLSRDAWGRLHRHLRRILTSAVVAQGTTFRDYRTGTGARGRFQFALKVYGREGEPCLSCGTALAGTHSIDARITVFCHHCQR
jgi:formamidopyrimidine-DNA glycosylase